MNQRKPQNKVNKDSLWTLRSEKGGLDKFIKAHPAEVEKESLERVINASAKPLGNRKASQSKSDADNFGGYK